MHKTISQLSRWLHIYLSMISFALVLFFAVTGLTLNHPDWFATEPKPQLDKGKLPANLLAGLTANGGPRLELVEWVRAQHRITAPVAEVRVDDSQVGVSFKGPGYTGDLFADRATGQYELSQTRMGAVAIFNDLHKGRDSGKVWSFLLDASAVFMVLVSISGLAILFYLPKRRPTGLATGVAGALLAVLVYRFFVA